MLRWAVILLVLANAGYFAWTQGYLDGLGMAPVNQREPQRLAQQVKPETLRLLNGPKGLPADEPAPEAVPATPPAPAPEAPPAPPAPPIAAVPQSEGPRACWQAAGFSEPQTEL